MPRPRPQHITLRGAPALDEMDELSTADLIAITIAAPGKVVTSGSGVPWQATPRHMAQADAILRARGVWDPPPPAA